MYAFRNICILIVIVLLLWLLISVLRNLTRPLRKKLPPAPKLYENTSSNGTHMVIGGFSHPNYLYSMNRVPYNGPI